MKRMWTGALVLAFLVVFGAVQANDKDKPNPTGTWTWKAAARGGGGGGGQAMETTLKLKLEGDKLTGTISGRGGQDTAIEEATFKDGEIAFSVTRERNGQKMTTKYTGKISGDSIKGKIEGGRGGNTQARDWEAKRAKETPKDSKEEKKNDKP